MTLEEVAEWLKFMQENEHNKADCIVPCTTEIALGIAVEALKQPEIIRCKDCIYADKDGWNRMICVRVPYQHFVVDEKWFCAGGERREGDDSA